MGYVGTEQRAGAVANLFALQLWVKDTEVWLGVHAWYSQSNLRLAYTTIERRVTCLLRQTIAIHHYYLPDPHQLADS